jgi:thiosulfate reductase cytochrome b subunit
LIPLLLSRLEKVMAKVATRTNPGMTRTRVAGFDAAFKPASRGAPKTSQNSGQVPHCLCYPPRVSATTTPQLQATQRHTALVRITHWITVISFLVLLVTGAEIVISHPRFYWGETGNSGTTPLFRIPIPASRGTVPSGYNYVMPDQNGWSRYLHFEAAWVLVITGLVYVVASLVNSHFRKNLIPVPADRKWSAFRRVFARYLRRAPPDPSDSRAYNVVQRTAYLLVIFVLFPLVIWTGLALSPAFDSAVPAAVNLLGGRQSARTLHFFVSGFLVLFLIVHVAMIALAGFWSRMRAMITGRLVVPSERP